MSDQDATQEENVEEAAAPTAGSIDERIQNQFNEEKWTRISSKDVSISRFKLLESLLDEAETGGILDKVKSLSKEHLEEYEPSVGARYFLGMIALKTDTPEEILYLKQLLDQFQEGSKWAVVDFLSDKMLNESENRTILRAKANALEKLGKNKELIPILEKLAKIDRKNPDISLKYADAIIAEDKDKAIQFYKITAESYAKNLQFDKLKGVWNKLVDLIPEDFAFFRKIERILGGHRQKEILADLFVNLAYHFIKKEDVDNIILLSKKILDLNPNYSRFKNELIRNYRAKYGDHSLLEDFIKYSGLLDSRRNISNSIQNFETNIVFDKENYVFHRVWGVGKIKELDTEQMVIDFKDKPAHRMDIQMALKSLKPLQKNHFWVHQFENPDELKDKFENDFVNFFKILLVSFGNSISLADIKAEIADVYIPLKTWSKWWTKKRAELLKDNHIRISPNRKDLLELHETEVTFSEMVIDKFQATPIFDERVAVALDALKETHDAIDALEFMVSIFKEGLKSLDFQTRLQSVWLLDLIHEKLGEEDEYYAPEIKENIVSDFQAMGILDGGVLGQNLKSAELKKVYSKWLKEYHEEWQKIYIELLMQTPIKIHKNLVLDLIAEDALPALQEFYQRMRKESKDNAEIFIWSMKNLVTGSWKVEGVPLNEQILSFFRLMRQIPKIELKGTKLKNGARDMVVGGSQEELVKMIANEAKESVRKLASLMRDVPYLNDLEKGRMRELLVAVDPKAFEDDEDSEDTGGQPHDQLLEEIEKTGIQVASINARDTVQTELDNLIKVEIPQNSEEIGLAQEKGDLRENSEYKAAMERQIILQAQVTKLEENLKKVKILTSDRITLDHVTLGSKVKLKDADTGDIFVYSILDDWDADVDKGIISYRSPLGKALINSRLKDVATFGSAKSEQKLEVLSIDHAVDREGNLN